MKQKHHLILVTAITFLSSAILVGCGEEKVSSSSSSAPSVSSIGTVTSSNSSVSAPSSATSEATKQVTGIEITTQPTKTVYKEGEKFNPAGMVVTATYDDDTTAPVTDYTYSNHNALSIEDTEIVISYEGFTATVTIKVEKVYDVTVEALQTYRFEAEDLDTSEATLREDFIAANRGFIENGAEASGGHNLCGYNPGSKFHISLNLMENATLYITASMSDTDTNYDLDSQGLKIEMDDTVLSSQNDAKFFYSGGTDYWNWVNVEYGKVELPKGEHIFTITSLQKRPNIDYFDFEVLSYADQSVERNMTGIVIDTLPEKTQYEAGEVFDPTGMVVKAKYSNHDVEVIADYTIDKADTPLTLADDKIIVTYQNFTADVSIVVGKAYQLKLNSLGDHIFEAEDLKVDDQWIMRSDMAAAGYKDYIVQSSGSSGGKSIERYDVGTVFNLEFYVADDSRVHFTSVLSNYDPFVLNDAVEFKLDDTVLTSDNPEFGHRTPSDYYNWRVADFNAVELTKGEHTLTVTLKSMHPNFDCFNFHVMKLGEAEEEHRLNSVSIASLPTKTSYIVGDVFDPSGMTLKLIYTDSLYEIVEEGFVCDTEPLSEETTSVEVTYGDFHVYVDVTVRAIDETISETKTIRIEGEDFDKTNLTHNGKGYVENYDGASGGKCLGNGTVGTCEWNYALTEAMTLDIKASLCKYEDYYVRNQFKIFIDNTEINLQDMELKLGRTDGNDWFNFKEADYEPTNLEEGIHTIKMQIIGCNVDYLQFTFTAAK